ncbi:MAG: hypothetical protein ACQESR_03630 [Planctomycetota bacterium]
MERFPTQAVLPSVGLAAGASHRRPVDFRRLDFSGWNASRRKPSSRRSDSRRSKSSATGRSVVYVSVFLRMIQSPRDGQS